MVTVGGKAEKTQKDEWTTVVWEDGETMPESVWSDKRRNELSKTIAETITTATGSKEPTLSGYTGTVIPWHFSKTKECGNCKTQMPSGSRYCPNCGKEVVD